MILGQCHYSRNRGWLMASAVAGIQKVQVWLGIDAKSEQAIGVQPGAPR
jgi:hypothetical protein